MQQTTSQAKLIFDYSSSRRCSKSLRPVNTDQQLVDDFPAHLLRKKLATLPQASELDVVRHYTALSQKNFSIDSHFYPLGSCTMKYNPKVCHSLASLPELTSRHPLAHDSLSQGFFACLYDLQEILKNVTGMAAVSLAPMAGAQGEFAGIAMIRAYHEQKNDHFRTEIIIPNAAHGTNPASAVMCGYKVKEIATNAQGDVDLDALRAAVGPQTAGIMLTNPSTLGVFEQQIIEIAQIIHQAGGLLYYDGANLNAILGKVRPGDMGFDVIHVNLHKTFSTPHGGGGPGAGPIGVSKRLTPFLPVPLIAKKSVAEKTEYYCLDEKELPLSIGRLSHFMGNAGILIRAYIYALLLGKEGFVRVAEFSTLNANYLMQQLANNGFELAFPQRRATHEFIISFKQQLKNNGVNAMEFAKRLLDYGVHAPTTYFPMLVPECFLIEPTETESKQSLDDFIQIMVKIKNEVEQTPELVKQAPHNLSVKRLDDVKAARELNVNYFS